MFRDGVLHRNQELEVLALTKSLDCCFYQDDGVTFRNGNFRIFRRQCFVHGWRSEGTLMEADGFDLHVGI